MGRCFRGGAECGEDMVVVLEEYVDEGGAETVG